MFVLLFETNFRIWKFRQVWKLQYGIVLPRTPCLKRTICVINTPIKVWGPETVGSSLLVKSWSRYFLFCSPPHEASLKVTLWNISDTYADYRFLSLDDVVDFPRPTVMFKSVGLKFPKIVLFKQVKRKIKYQTSIRKFHSSINHW